jgi:hypothetical protein
LVVALAVLTLALQAGTTVVDVELGDSFTGTIDTAGVDTVEARLSATEGTSVRVTVRADRGSTLEPTVVVKDSLGTPLGLGTTQHISWLPVGNLIHYFTVPATGSYTIEIGGASGSGDFWASVTGAATGSVELASLSGTVTSSLTGDPVPDVSVLVDDALFAITDNAGSYSGELSPGSYSVSFRANGFETLTESVDLSAGLTTVLDVSVVPLVPVVVTASVSGDAVTGGSLTGTVDVVAPAGTTINSITWTQTYGATAGIMGANPVTISLGTESEYRDELIHVLSEPPVGEEELPPNVPLPPGEFPGGLQNRFQVVGINPFALEEAGLVVLSVEVDTDLGIFGDEVEIHTALPWKPNTSLRNVPSGIPVLLQGKEQLSYDWVLTGPVASNATLTDATSRNPYFTPDIPGLYELDVTDQAAAGTVTVQVYSGTWRGVIVDQDIDGRPVADGSCTSCHDDDFAADKFTPWMQTGHAEILTNNLNTSTHYGPNCFPCHSVGFDPEIDNDGFDDAPDYQAFLDAGLLNNPGDNWTTMLEDFPDAAQLANIQCENCHGPQRSNAHGFAGPLGEPRVDLSSDVCAVCHGEPLRHARFQQWQLSAHANYELAIDEGDSGNCSRCHTGNGFLTWLPILLDDDPNTDPLDDITVNWTLDETHPQTCATCHDPHAIGTTSGGNTNATVRISGDTPPLIAGFQVNGAGGGAICMTCHNSRRGLRNDDTFDDFFGTSEAARAPHGSAQTDVLMGQNAYLIPVGVPGGHGLVEDTCVECHMRATPPPDILSYNQGGTNHTFFAATDICGDCHSPRLLAEDVQDGIQHLLDQVGALMEDGLLTLIGDLTAAGNTIDLNGDATITDVDEVAAIQFGETRGRQAITVIFNVGGTFGPYRMTDVDVLDGTPAVIGQLYDFADPALIKSGWNWNLFNNDGSLGVHNPIFAFDGLRAARDALVAAPASRSVPTSRSVLTPRGREWRELKPSRSR